MSSCCCCWLCMASWIKISYTHICWVCSLITLSFTNKLCNWISIHWLRLRKKKKTSPHNANHYQHHSVAFYHTLLYYHSCHHSSPPSPPPSTVFPTVNYHHNCLPITITSTFSLRKIFSKLSWKYLSFNYLRHSQNEYTNFQNKIRPVMI